MPKYCRPEERKDFHIAVICALRPESDAVEAMFDEDWETDQKYLKAKNDKNEYTMGRIGEHNVVLAFLPGIGKKDSATLTSSFIMSFPKIRLGLVVGVCGGTPFIRENWGTPMDTLKDSLGRPNTEIRSFLNKMQGMKSRERLQEKIRDYLAKFSQQKGFEKWKYQGVEKDILYKSERRHKHQLSTDCAICAQGEDVACEKARGSTCEDLKCASEQSV